MSLIKENSIIALQSVKNNKLRSVLTILIIAIGIMAMVGILTAIDAIKFYLDKNFTQMGASTIKITSDIMSVEGKDKVEKKIISYDDALTFKHKFPYNTLISISHQYTSTATIKYKNNKTNPNISVYGVDENYLLTSGKEVAKGRGFTATDGMVTVIGDGLTKKLFANINPIGKQVSINNIRFTIVGVLKSQGSTFGFSSDKMCIIPVHILRNVFSLSQADYTISVLAKSVNDLDFIVDEATGYFRIIRNIRPDKSDNFTISKSSDLAKRLNNTINILRIAAIIISIITLSGAVIGLMNIMLVSVNERTREIGIRKSIGAKRKTIRNQFLFEAIVIAQLGGLVGIILGVIIGNVVSFAFKAGFIIPWFWILIGVLACFIVSILSGFIPANKASKLDPVEALRYE